MILSNNQLAIIKSNKKHIVVTAGAGSGKTTVLIEHALHIINTKPTNSKILVLTFSNKAANELEKKAGEKIENYKDHLYIGTIHKFCTDIISKYGHTIGLSPNFQILESNEERLEMFTSAIDNFPGLKYAIASEKNPSTVIRNLFDEMGMIKRNTEKTERASPEHRQLFQEYNELMISQNAIDFDDILDLSLRLLNEVKSVLRIYQKIFTSICVDEAQDLNSIQYEIIKTLSGNDGSLFLVGDPNQAIYGFNGSSSKYMLHSMKDDYKDVEEYTISENYRSSEAVIDAAKRIEPQFSLEGQIPIKGEFKITCYEDDLIEAKEIATMIKELLVEGHRDTGSLDPNQICILARNRYVLDNIHDALSENNIESSIKLPGSGFSFESPFFVSFILGLRLIMNDRDQIHLNKLINILECDTNTSISDILEGTVKTKFCGYDTLKTAWLNFKRDYLNGEYNDSSFEILGQFCNDENNFKNESEKYLITKDYSDLKFRLKMYINGTIISERNLNGLMRSMSLGSLNTTSENGVILSTVHMSKGLEYDVVFIVSVNEGVLPDYRSKDCESIAEEKHNLFVSITRSKRLCYISYVNKRNTKWGLKSQIPSRFITYYYHDYLSEQS